MEKIVFLKMPDMDDSSLNVIHQSLREFHGSYCYARLDTMPEYVVFAVDTNLSKVNGILKNSYIGAHEIPEKGIKKGNYSVVGIEHLWPLR